MKNLLSFIAFLLILTLCLIGAWHLLGIRQKTFVQDISQVPFMQAVLITKDGPELLIGQEQIEEFLATHRDATFLIPPQEREMIQARLNESVGEDYGVSLQVEPIAEGRQRIEVYFHGDPSDYSLGYEATSRKIIPKYYIRFSVVDLMLVCIVAILPTILIHEVSRRYVRKRWNKALANQ